mmetsp:Transcript_6176/g.14513  ORF Transcript_6176/g.14513 Transcript_6176/m.14513 type:complete len:156 (-) Transcript_6176:93-560(-)
MLKESYNIGGALRNCRCGCDPINQYSARINITTVHVKSDVPELPSSIRFLYMQSMKVIYECYCSISIIQCIYMTATATAPNKATAPVLLPNAEGAEDSSLISTSTLTSNSSACPFCLSSPACPLLCKMRTMRRRTGPLLATCKVTVPTTSKGTVS